MVSKASIDTFLNQRKLAILGVSRNKKEFSNSVYRLLKERGYTVYPVNPYTENIEGDRCYPNIKALTEQVDGVLILLPPKKTEQVLPEIASAGIRQVWIQQMSDTKEAIEFCKQHNIEVIYGECILMFMEPLSFPHRLHRWGKKVFGKLPT
jgi:uncharacterized protein